MSTILPLSAELGLATTGFSAAAAATTRVVCHLVDPSHHASLHERASLQVIADRVSAMLRNRSDGAASPSSAPPTYYLPSDTLTRSQADELGIRDGRDLFGGIVPHAFVATKAITHPRIAADAASILGWNDEMAQRLDGSVAAGFTVFSLDDAHRAGRLLLQRGPCRLKPTRATGSSGQTCVQDIAALEAALAACDDATLAVDGLVLEEQLVEDCTISVGQVEVGGITATYHGEQRSTLNHAGHKVYGGTSLLVARGGFDELLALSLPPEKAHAVAQARRYDEAARAAYPGLITSRCNYDVLVGRDIDGVQRCAVLEQSWRVGGATPAELTAIEAFRADATLQHVRATCIEAFSAQPPPSGAIVGFHGIDPQVGALSKYAFLETA